MNTLQQVISIMYANECKEFKAHLNKQSKRKDVNNIRLFDMLKTDDIIGIKKLYPFENSAAYHAIRKRLYDTLIDFMANRTFVNDTSAEHEILKLVVVSRKFFELKLAKAAFKCLARAEARAQQLEHYSLLNEIYGVAIQYAHLDPAVDIKNNIVKFNINKDKLIKEEQLTIAYAVLRNELQAIYHKGQISNLQELIAKTMEEHGISLDVVLTYKSLYQMLYIANEYAAINSNYTAIESFMVHSYHLLGKNNEGSGQQLYYQIYIQYFMANLHFRNCRFIGSGKYLDTMLALMQMQDNKYYNRFAVRYFMMRAFNFHFSGDPGVAIGLAQKTLKDHPDAHVADKNDLQLALVMFHLQIDSAREAQREMNLLSGTDSYYEKMMGRDWAIKKSLLEIVLHVQLGNDELALSRIKSFNRRYKKFLLQVDENRVIKYVRLLLLYINKPEQVKTAEFKNAYMELVEQAKKSGGDIFVLGFAAWLWAKAAKRPVYEVTLSIMGGS